MGVGESLPKKLQLFSRELHLISGQILHRRNDRNIQTPERHRAHVLKSDTHMEWFYADFEDNQQGPVTFSQLRDLWGNKKVGKVW